MKNATPHRDGLVVAPAVYRRREREQLAQLAAGAQVPNARRDHPTAPPSERKQPGRRYGPPPRHLPHPRMQAPEPMSLVVRADIYRCTGSEHRFTRRQMRRYDRMAAAQTGFPPKFEGKNRPTPKRREASR